MREICSARHVSVTEYFSSSAARRTDSYCRSFFAYPIEIRKIIYTTNIIEGLNRQFRQITKNKPSFTNDDSLRRMLYLSSRKIVEHWTARCRNWDMLLSQLQLMSILRGCPSVHPWRFPEPRKPPLSHTGDLPAPFSGPPNPDFHLVFPGREIF